MGYFDKVRVIWGIVFFFLFIIIVLILGLIFVSNIWELLIWELIVIKVWGGGVR